MQKILRHVSSILLSLVLCLTLASCSFSLQKRDKSKLNGPVFHGVEDVTIEKGTQFLPLQGVSVTDEEEGNINVSAVSVDARGVNVNVEGEYTVTYTVYDADGNMATATRKVTVVYTDTVKPEIYGVADTHVTVGDTSFNVLNGVSAIDLIDGNVELSVNGSVDIWTIGEYHVFYEAADNSGNKNTVDRLITVDCGNFEFGELENIPASQKISGGEILSSIADYSLVKFELVLDSEEPCEVKVNIEGCQSSTKGLLVDGETTLTVYARFEEELVDALCSIESEGAFTIKSAKYAFAMAGDHQGPEFARSIETDVYVPVGATAEFAKSELLRGVTAFDNLDGNVTSKITVDMKDADLSVAGTYEVVLKCADSLGNESLYPLQLNVAVARDTHIITDPGFDEAENSQWKLSSGAGGSVTYEIADGVYKLNIVTAGGWASGDSPYLSGINTSTLEAGQYYMFKMDVKADVARAINIRSGLELWTDPWMENFRDTVKYQVGTEWSTIYFVFYLPTEKSADGSNVIKFEVQCGSIDWSSAESNNVLYFDNAQFYLLSNDNKTPVISVVEDKPTTIAIGSEMPDFTEYFTVQDLEDGEIEVTEEMITNGVDLSVAGEYKVKLTVTDADGATAEKEITIKVIAEVDEEGPQISIPAVILSTISSYMPVKEGADLTDIFASVLAQVSIVDNVDGEITVSMDMVDLDGLKVNSANTGTFNVSISCKDSSGNESNVISFTVEVVDGKAPVIVGVHNYTVYVGDTLNPMSGVCGYDTTDGVIACTLEMLSGFEEFLDGTGKVVGEAGQYQVTYTIADEAGNEATATAIVTVVAEKPEYNYSGAQDMLAKQQALGGGTKSTIVYNEGVGTATYIGNSDWWASACQLKYTSNVNLVAGTTYKLVLEAKAELPREIVIYFVDGDMNKIPGFEGDGEGATLQKLKVGLTNEYYVFEYEFTPTSASSNASTLEFDLGWESYLLNSGLDNVISFKQIKIVAQGEEQGDTPVEVEPIVLDDFESYADTDALALEWARRYGGVNYNTGFELVEVAGNKVAKLEYASDNKYLLRYVGSNFPTLTDDYKYVRFKAQFASEETPVEVWLYWSGSQNGINYTPSAILMSDGYYYVKISDWGKSASVINGFAIGFNYKAGNEAYFDDIEFVAALPAGDYEAPVISLDSTVAAQLAAMELMEGESLVDLFTQLQAAISIVDDVDGEIALAQSMINLGGLDLANPAAGTYKVTIKASDAAGNEGKLELSIVIKSSAPAKELENALVIDFEDGAGSGSYVNSHWKQEKYTTEWVEMTGQMNSRVNGTKIANIVGGYSMTNKYTYTFDETLEDICHFEMKAGNYFSGAIAAPIKVVLVKADDSLVYLFGSSSEFYSFPVTTAFETLSVDFEACDVKAFYIVFKSGASSSVYLYLDDITFAKEKVEEEPELENALVIDFEDGAGSGSYVNSHWKQEKYTTEWVEMTGQMNSRVNGTKIANIVGGYSMTNKYTYTFDETLEDICHFEMKAGNYFSGAIAAPIKVVLVKADDSLVYLFGSSSEFYSFPVTTAFETLSVDFEACDVKAFYIVFKSGASSSVYLYLDDITFAKEKGEEPEADTTAPVISLDSTVAAQLAGMDLYEGESLLTLFGNLLGAISIVDDVDGVILMDDATTDLGGLSLMSPVAGTYKVTIKATDAAGNEGKLELSIVIKEKAPEKELENVLVLDFEETAGSGTYTDSRWLQQVYTTQWDTKTDKMNSRTKGDTKVVNIYSGYSMTYMYTFTPASTLEDICHFEMMLGNYFDGASAAGLKISLIKTDGTKVYLLGDASTFGSFAVTTGLEKLSYDFEAIDVKQFVITFKSTLNGNAYLYMDDITFAKEKGEEPEADTTAPVVSLEGDAAENLAALELFEGDSLVQLFTELQAVISIVDDVDGEIAFTQSMLNLGGLDLTNPAAGNYTVTIKASDAAGNEGQLQLPIVIKAKPVSSMVLDFEETAGSGTYTNSAWLQQKYTDKWETMTGQMNSRTKDATKVVNITGGYSMTNKYTYTHSALISGANHFSMKLGNYFSNAAAASIKIAVVKANGDAVYVLGSSSEFYSFHVTTGLETLEGWFEEADIKGFYIVFKSTVGSSVYLYMDDITINNEEEPVADTTAPTISFSSAVASYMTSTTFWSGEDLTSAFASLKSGITVTDDVDGAITNFSVTVEGLSMTNPVAGNYTIVVSATDAAGNTARQEVPFVVTQLVASVGSNKYSSFSAALASSGLPANPLVVYPGTIAGDYILSSGVTIEGPNKSYSGTSSARGAEAVFTGCITIPATASEVEIWGVQFTGNSYLVIDGTNTLIFNCLFTETINTVPSDSGMTRRSVIRNTAPTNGLFIANCYFNFADVEAVWEYDVMACANKVTDLSITTSKFHLLATSYASYNEIIRINNIDGVLEISNNEFEYAANQYSLFLGSSANTTTEVIISDNIFSGVGSLPLAGFAIRKGGASAKTTIIGNQFDNMNGNILNFGSSAAGHKASVIFNIFGSKVSYKHTDLGSATVEFKKNSYAASQTTATPDYSATYTRTDCIADYYLYINPSMQYELNGGEWAEQEGPTTIVAETVYTLPTPVKEGVQFAGWYDNPEFSGNSYTSFVGGYVGKLYAKWVTQTHFTIAWNLDGGEWDDEEGVEEYDIGDTVALPTPEKAGYLFAGWYTGDTQISSIVSGDYSLTAHWQKILAYIGSNAYTSFDAAYAAAQAGDTITLVAGSYTLPASCTKAITIAGPNALIPADGTRVDEAVISGSGVQFGSSIEFVGVKLSGYNDQTNFTVTSSSNKDFTFKNCILTKFNSVIRYDAEGAANGSVKFEGCKFDTIYQFLIKGDNILNLNSILVKDCIFAANNGGVDNSGAGLIRLNKSGATTVCTVVGCTFEGALISANNSFFRATGGTFDIQYCAFNGVSKIVYASNTTAIVFNNNYYSESQSLAGIASVTADTNTFASVAELQEAYSNLE